MSGPKEFNVDIEYLDGYRFEVSFDKESMGKLITDETVETGGDEEGPPPSRLLAASTLNCLMASLLFCLRKKSVKLESLEGEVVGTMDRVEGRLKITHLDVTIETEISPDDEEKVNKCADIFEDYCIVTQSVREGIEVDVSVESGV